MNYVILHCSHCGEDVERMIAKEYAICFTCKQKHKGERYRARVALIQHQIKKRLKRKKRPPGYSEFTNIDASIKVFYPEELPTS